MDMSMMVGIIISALTLPFGHPSPMLGEGNDRKKHPAERRDVSLVGWRCERQIIILLKGNKFWHDPEP